MGAAIGTECVCRDRLAAVGCVDDGRRSVHEEDKKALEGLRQQVAILQRRNAALEEVATAHRPASGPRAGVSSVLGVATTGRESRHMQGAQAQSDMLLPAVTLPQQRRREAAAAAAAIAAKAHGEQGGGMAAASAAPHLSPRERGRLLAEAAEEALRSVPLPVGLLFPNQSLGLVGMLGQAGDVPRAQELLRRASSVLDYDLEQLCTVGPASKLDMTRHCQPAVYVASIAAAERLRLERPEVFERCQAVAGIGVGEFAALHVAGVFDFELGLKLVRLRAEEMHRASAVGEQQQLSITGVELERVRALCEEARRSCGGDEVCSVAYAVAPKAHICAGTRAAVQQLLAVVKKQGSKDVHVDCLDTPQQSGYGAFQTVLMEQALQHFKAGLYEALPLMRPPRCAVYFNVMGEALPAGAEPTLVVELLAAQIKSTVLWEQTVRTMLREGVEELIVCSPSTSSQLTDVIPLISADAGRRTKNCSL